MPLFTTLGLAATALSGVCLYAASPHQRIWARSWRRLPSLLCAMALLGIGWVSLVQAMFRVTATFVLLTAMMLVLTTLPYAGAWIHARRIR